MIREGQVGKTWEDGKQTSARATALRKASGGQEEGKRRASGGQEDRKRRAQ
jgi:hypothetical protein